MDISLLYESVQTRFGLSRLVGLEEIAAAAVEAPERHDEIVPPKAPRVLPAIDGRAAAALGARRISGLLAAQGRETVRAASGE